MLILEMAKTRSPTNSPESSLDFSRPIVIPEEDAQYQMIGSKLPNQKDPHARNYNNFYLEHGSFKSNHDDNADSLRLPSSNSLTWQAQPMEGSFYEWRKIVSDCSVSCGSGIACR